MKSSVILCLVLTSLLILSNLEAFSLGVFRFLLVAEIVVIPLIGIALVVFGRVKRRSKMAPIGLAFVISCALGLIISREIAISKTEDSKALGDRICISLNEYESALGHYPDSLSDLVPDYLDEVSISNEGVFTDVPFTYSVTEAMVFYLASPQWVDSSIIGGPMTSGCPSCVVKIGNVAAQPGVAADALRAQLNAKPVRWTTVLRGRGQEV